MTTAIFFLVSLVALFCCVSSESWTPASKSESQPPLTMSTLTTSMLARSTTATAPSTSTRSESGPVTTAPIYLPYYLPSTWSALRGSILSSDRDRDCTTYTIFCRSEPTQACDIALDFPFIFAQGPETIEFHGTYTSTFIANVACALDGQTAATCSGYSSFKSGYKKGHITGPTDFSWTSTLTGTDVQWGVLTMADIPPRPTRGAGNGKGKGKGNGNGNGGGDDDGNGDSVNKVSMPPTRNTDLLFGPSNMPGSGAVFSSRAVGAWTVAVVAASAVFAGLLL